MTDQGALDRRAIADAYIAESDKRRLRARGNRIEGDAKHTPGPWETKDRAGHLDVYIGHLPVAFVAAIPSSAANAHLMAAAPDLLAACEGIMEELERGLYNGGTSTMYSEACRKAVAKAAGATNT